MNLKNLSSSFSCLAYDKLSSCVAVSWPSKMATKFWSGGFLLRKLTGSDTESKYDITLSNFSSPTFFLRKSENSFCLWGAYFDLFGSNKACSLGIWELLPIEVPWRCWEFKIICFFEVGLMSIFLISYRLDFARGISAASLLSFILSIWMLCVCWLLCGRLYSTL
jgi:hypothetical protein